MNITPAGNADSLAIAEELILKPGGLDLDRLQTVLGGVMSSTIDAADVYFQLSRDESWALEDGIVKDGSASIEQGVGVRALSGEKTGFAYSDEINAGALVSAARATRTIARQGAGRAARRPNWRRDQGIDGVLVDNGVVDLLLRAAVGGARQVHGGYALTVGPGEAYSR